MAHYQIVETENGWELQMGLSVLFVHNDKEVVRNELYKVKKPEDTHFVDFSLDLKQRAEKMGIDLYAKPDRRLSI